MIEVEIKDDKHRDHIANLLEGRNAFIEPCVGNSIDPETFSMKPFWTDKVPYLGGETVRDILTHCKAIRIHCSNPDDETHIKLAL